MSSFAHIIDGVVVNVILATQEYIDSQDSLFIEYEDDDNNVIKNIIAGRGYTYDEVNDVFIAPQPYDSWSLDNNYEWQSPVAKPDDFDTRIYIWDEENLSWVPFIL
jgi:hypothetical protein